MKFEKQCEHDTFISQSTCSGTCNQVTAKALCLNISPFYDVLWKSQGVPIVGYNNLSLLNNTKYENARIEIT